MLSLFNGGDCLLEPQLFYSLYLWEHTHTRTNLLKKKKQVTSAWSRIKYKATRTAGGSYSKLALDDTANLLAYFVGMGVRLLCRWIRLCLNITCPWENCNEVDLVNGNLSITISQRAVYIQLQRCLPVIISDLADRAFKFK